GLLSVPKYLLRYGGFVLSVTTARVVGSILTAATFPFLVRRLGVDIYGLWSYVVAVLVVARLEVRQDVRFLLTWYGVASVLTSSLSLDYLLSSLELFHVQAF